LRRYNVSHCVHCGRIWIFTKESGSDNCSCGAELYPVSRKLSTGELILADGFLARVLGIEDNAHKEISKDKNNE
jgi:hypothetical protein